MRVGQFNLHGENVIQISFRYNARLVLLSHSHHVGAVDSRLYDYLQIYCTVRENSTLVCNTMCMYYFDLSKYYKEIPPHFTASKFRIHNVSVDIEDLLKDVPLGATILMKIDFFKEQVT